MSRPSDRNLLFGILALQMDFVARTDLLDAMQAWLLNKDKTLGELLCEREVLSAENRALLEPLVDAHVRQHGGEAQHSLAALSSDGGLVAELAQADDDELQQSLSLLPRPEESRPREVGFPSSAAQPADQEMENSGKLVPASDSPDDQNPEAPIAARFQETLIPGTLDQLDEPKMRFRILRPHAEGGLGRVHVALDQELNREVAFKEIKFEFARRKDAQARFVVEAEVTGGLEHPGIVPVYGLGHFPDGRPFYAMRFIRGQSLHDAVREFHDASLTTENVPYNSNRAFRDLINRLIDVCNAIEYAHSRKVLHRDLKPGNIMLGRYGETLVVDWGLAKAQGTDEPLERSTDGELPIVPASGSQSAPTMAGSAIGTPAYMSPEQAEGKVDLLGPASDIYSLGATLYEILTGQAPLKGLKIAEILKRVSTGDIPNPRDLNPPAPLALQAVCRKAMALQPQDRYATAKALADDLEAWLADEPVSAWPEPLLVRARRWAKRNQTLVTSTAAAVLMAAVTLSVMFVVVAGQNEQLAQLNDDLDSSNQQLGEKNTALTASIDRETAARQLAQQNEQRAIAGEELARQNEARAVAGEELAQANAAAATEQSRLALSTLKSVIFDVQRSLENIAGGTAVRRQLLSTVLPQLEQVSTEFSNKSAVDRTTAAALIDLGDVVLQLGQSHPHAPREESNAPKTGATDTAERLYRRAHAIARQLFETNSDDPLARRNLSVSLDRLGDLVASQGNLPEAARLFGESLDIRRRLAESDLGNAQGQRNLSAALEKLGDLAMSQRNLPGAAQLFGESLNIRRQLVKSAPGNAEWQFDLGISNERLGNLAQARGDLGAASRFHQARHEIIKRLAESDPGHAAWQRDLWVSFGKLGDLASAQGDLPRARKFWGDAHLITRRLAESDPGNAQWQRDLSVSLHNLGELTTSKEKLPEAARLFGESLDIRRRLAESDPDNVQWQRNLSVSLQKHGELATSQENLPEAARLFGESLDIHQRLAESDPSNALWQRDLAISSERLGDLAFAKGNLGEAATWFEKSRVINQRRIDLDPSDLESQRGITIPLNRLGDLATSQGNLPEAARLFGESLDINRRLADSDPGNAVWQRDLMFSHYKLGGLQQAELQFDAALKEYRLGEAVLERMIEKEQNVEQSRRELQILQDAIRTCEVSLFVTGEWDALLARPAKELPLLLTKRCALLAGQRRTADVEQAATKLQELAASAPDGTATDQKAGMLYNAACGYGLCAKLSSGWDGKSPEPGERTPEQQAERDRFVTLALTALKAAVEAGFDDFEHLQQDADLSALHGLPEFKALLPQD
ncbi:MAG: protein kinase domain-containing protein [Planctomycetales bacterium]